MSISVVVPTLIRTNKHLSLTARCLEKARHFTKIPFELVIVETETEYLEDYADVYIHEEVKTTASKSINRGFHACTGDYICLLTNDVLVAPSWLDYMLECFSKKADCGIATLATTQFRHKQEDKIEEGVWFSVAMFRKQDEYFGESYENSWDDTDFIMRQYIEGKKSYRNYNCVVGHNPGQTAYADPRHREIYNRNSEYFKEKFAKYKEMDIYQKLTSETVF